MPTQTRANNRNLYYTNPKGNQTPRKTSNNQTPKSTTATGNQTHNTRATQPNLQRQSENPNPKSAKPLTCTPNQNIKPPANHNLKHPKTAKHLPAHHPNPQICILYQPTRKPKYLGKPNHNQICTQSTNPRKHP